MMVEHPGTPRKAPQVNDERIMKLHTIKQSIDRASYVVDPQAVAEAMLRRVAAARQAQPGGRFVTAPPRTS